MVEITAQEDVFYAYRDKDHVDGLRYARADQRREETHGFLRDVIRKKEAVSVDTGFDNCSEFPRAMPRGARNVSAIERQRK